MFRRKHQKPDTKATVPPKLDQFITDFAPKKVDKAWDAALTKVHGRLLYAANPLANLWVNLIDQHLEDDQQAVVPVGEVFDVIQRSLVLLGNGNNLVSERRREVALEAIRSSLKKYAKGDFTQAGSDLFGEKFKEELVQKVEVDGALSKAVRIVSQGTKAYHNPQSVTFSRPNQWVQGCVRHEVQPIQNGRWTCGSQWKGKCVPGKRYHKKGNVFEHLGQQTDRSAAGHNSDQDN